MRGTEIAPGSGHLGSEVPIVARIGEYYDLRGRSVTRYGS